MMTLAISPDRVYRIGTSRVVFGSGRNIGGFTSRTARPAGSSTCLRYTPWLLCWP